MWLAARLAEGGCAVALSTCVVPFGPGSCLLSAPFDMSALGSPEAYKRNPSAAGLRAIVDALRELSAASEGPLAGRLDLTKLAVGGHSSGGRTALDLAAFDNDFGFGAVFPSSVPANCSVYGAHSSHSFCSDAIRRVATSSSHLRASGGRLTSTASCKTMASTRVA